MENKYKGLQKEMSETEEVKSRLEHEKVGWEQELCRLRCAVFVFIYYCLMFCYTHSLICERIHLGKCVEVGC